MGFFVKIATPWRKLPLLFQQPRFQSWGPVKTPPFLKIWWEVRPPSRRGGGGAHYGKVAKYNSFGKSLKKKRNSGNLLENNPHMNVWRNGQVLTVSPFNWITWKEMRWHPYQICIRQQLTERKRLNIFNWLIRMSQIFS